MNTPAAPAGRRLMKIPSLNVVHVCGTIANAPRAISSTSGPVGALFDLSVRSYERGKKSTSVRLTVVCWGGLADGVIARLHEGDIILVMGALQNHPSPTASLQVTASAVQFLTSNGS